MWYQAIFFRLSAGLVVLACSILIVLDLLGFMPSAPREGGAAQRAQLCEAVAVKAALVAERSEYGALRKLLDATVEENEEVLSAALRSVGGRLLVATSDHGRLWRPDEPEKSTLTHVRVPLSQGDRRWGTIEVRFQELASQGLISRLAASPLFRLLAAFGLVGFLANAWFLKRSLRHLDPSAIIPRRVQATLDLMAEGVLLVDREERIVMANAAFGYKTGLSLGELLGTRASELGWLVPGSEEKARDLPWIRAFQESDAYTGTALSIRVNENEVATFMVNGAPVGDDAGRSRGAIATFDDISKLERKSKELQDALAELEKSRDEIRMQNEELVVLSRCDPLTGAANRRSFLQEAEVAFQAAKQSRTPLSCMMVDIDHFKRVNDNHGHAMGDTVIQRVVAELMSSERANETVCRYGGEELCSLLPDMDIVAAAAVAEQFRMSISAKGFSAVPISASFGVSTISSGAGTIYDLINQADEALYASKDHGRNRVTRRDQMPQSSGG